MTDARFEYNYSYYPVIFPSEEAMLRVKQHLFDSGFNTRRYFFPSLNLTPQVLNYMPCPISEDISKRVLCLPLYPDLPISIVENIAAIINELTL